MTTVDEGELIVFPDAEALVIAYLKPRISGVPVMTQVPSTRPPQLVRVMRTGGYRRDLITDVARLTFEYWALRETDAAGLCQLGRAHVLAWAGRSNDVQRVEEAAGPVNSPDPTSRTPRYVHTVEAALRCLPVAS